MTRPALGRADVVIADRFLYCAEVLARFGRGLPESYVRPVLQTPRPGGWSRTWWCWSTSIPHIARARRQVAKLVTADRRPPSRKGLGGVGMQHRFRDGYRELAARDPAPLGRGGQRPRPGRHRRAGHPDPARRPPQGRARRAGRWRAPRRATSGAALVPPTTIEAALARFLRWIDQPDRRASPRPPPICWRACAARASTSAGARWRRWRPRRCCRAWPAWTTRLLGAARGAGRAAPARWPAACAAGPAAPAAAPAAGGPGGDGPAGRAGHAGRRRRRRGLGAARAPARQRPRRGGGLAGTHGHATRAWACASAGWPAGAARRPGALRAGARAGALADRPGRRAGLGAAQARCARRPRSPRWRSCASCCRSGPGSGAQRYLARAPKTVFDTLARVDDPRAWDDAGPAGPAGQGGHRLDERAGRRRGLAAARAASPTSGRRRW